MITKIQLGLEILLLIALCLWGYSYHTRLRSLSKSISKLKEDMVKLEKETLQALLELELQMSSDVLPSPDMVKMIDATISDYITIEVLLTKNNKIKIGKEIIIKIAENTQKTYPHINKNYIAEKVLATCENIIGSDNVDNDSQ